MRVDGVNFAILGQGSDAFRPNLIGTTVTPTRTIINVIANNVEANITFLSPIEVRPFLFISQRTQVDQ
jgi:hypothetical protein